MRCRIAVLALALVALACEPVPTTGRVASPSPSPPTFEETADPGMGYPVGWTELPAPPETRSGDAWVWDGSDVLVSGGCDPEVEDRCRETRRTYALDLASRTWRRVASSPEPMTQARATWTGTEALFLETYDAQEPVRGQAYDPAADTWRPIAAGPMHGGYGVQSVWTGDELLVFGPAGDPHGDAGLPAAAYAPAADTWSRLSSAPIGLNLSSAMWTGRWALLFGSLLDRRNHASTPTSVGAIYDRGADSWRAIPPSALSPQATAAGWVGDRMVAWDYETTSQEFDPSTDRWSAPVDMPIAFSECYPETVVVSGLLLAWFCGTAALYDATTDAWERIGDGPLEETVYSKAYRSRIHVWRFAQLVQAGAAVILPMEGLTLTRRGEACYGCEGSPRSLWIFRPPPRVAPDTSFDQPRKSAVRSAASAFLSAWLQRVDARLRWMASPDGLARFEDAVPDVGSGTYYRLGSVEMLREGSFEVQVGVVIRDRDHSGVPRHVVTLSLVFGPGTSIGGEPSSLLLIHVRV